MFPAVFRAQVREQFDVSAMYNIKQTRAVRLNDRLSEFLH